jgi:hypothetical protein
MNTGGASTIRQRAQASKNDELNREEKRREQVISIALGEGIRNGVLSLSAAGLGVLAASRNQASKFNKYMGTSAKVAVPVMAGLFAFALTSELAIYSMNRDPSKWGISDKARYDYQVQVPLSHRNSNINSSSSSSGGSVAASGGYGMPFHHSILNFMHDRPFATVMGLGGPLAAFIFNEQYKLKHLKLSQRVMHTRVFAQGGILSILLLTMGAKDFIERKGRYEEY